MNVIQLARILGHNSLRMIERTYSHLDQSDANDTVLKMLTDERTRVASGRGKKRLGAPGRLGHRWGATFLGDS